MAFWEQLAITILGASIPAVVAFVGIRRAFRSSVEQARQASRRDEARVSWEYANSLFSKSMALYDELLHVGFELSPEDYASSRNVSEASRSRKLEEYLELLLRAACYAPGPVLREMVHFYDYAITENPDSTKLQALYTQTIKSVRQELRRDPVTDDVYTRILTRPGVSSTP